MQKIDLNLRILIAVFICFAVGIWFFENMVQLNIEKLLSSKIQIDSLEKILFPKEKTALIINFGEEKIKEFDANVKESISVFDLLERGTKELNLSLKTKKYDTGIFIEAIGNKQNGESGKYWLYYVNGKLPTVSVDKQLINPGDTVEFKFEESPF